MKHFFNSLFFYLAFLLPFAIHANPTGEVIFNHPLELEEVWIGNVQDKRSARRIYRQPLAIYELSVQKNGVYFVIVAERFVNDALMYSHDVYLINRKQLWGGPKNLTRGRFGRILDAAIFRKGDIVFTNFPKKGKVDFERGIYLIPNRELKKERPQPVLLKAVKAHNVDWSPYGKTVAYSTDDGIYLLDILTQNVSKIITDGIYPVYSPTGKSIAFLTTTEPTKIGILSLEAPHHLKHLELIVVATPRNMVWSPDGQYIAYTLLGRNRTANNYAVQINSGTTEQILEMYAGGVPTFDWTHTDYPFAVETADKLTILWGKLKQ